MYWLSGGYGNSLTQLPNIRHEKDDSLSINKLKNTMKKESVFDNRVAEIKRILIDMREAGVKEMKKKEIRDLIEVSDKSNFSKILKALNGFIIENDFVVEGQRISIKK
ncbi:hypothetical protein [Virgibacillus halodenitrificans]|uniref:hypothetical protein n=1 Tax=Virgibacillus halodenitrificans TaxID=1482 RepID=UPI002DBF20E4|nr:hypothetical protein [Virgibacillus halodenitrificans]MEC2157666.1 hypothetical protein [Virgibacillus halodenitrificans]